jgi:hypothetical protein
LVEKIAAQLCGALVHVFDNTALLTSQSYAAFFQVILIACVLNFPERC